MKKNINSLSILVMFFSLLLLSACEKDKKQNEVKLSKIEIVATPITTRGTHTLTLAKGHNQPLQATGYYSDNTKKNITSSVSWYTDKKETCSYIEHHKIKGMTKGSCQLYASMKSIKSNVLAITITDAALVGIQVEPSRIDLIQNTNKQLSVTGNFSDGTNVFHMENQVSWEGLPNTLATISTGLLTAVGTGTTKFTAKKDGISSNEITLNSIASSISKITLPPSELTLIQGQTNTLTGVETHNNGRNFPLSGATWDTTPSGIIAISNNGEISTIAMGTTSVTATKNEITSNSVTVNVTKNNITQITVSPIDISIYKGAQQQLNAIASYAHGSDSNITTTADWTVSDDIISINNNGLLVANQVGTTSFKASKDQVNSDDIKVTVVNDNISSIKIQAAHSILYPTENLQLNAIATLDSGIDVNMTNSVAWVSENKNIATISNEGVITAVDIGTTKINLSTTNLDNSPVNQSIDIQVTIPVCGNSPGHPLDTSSEGGINNADKTNALGICLKIIEVTGVTNHWFTNTPSLDLMWAAGFQWDQTSQIDGKTFAGHYIENGNMGPAGNFAAFYQKGVNEGQYHRWCNYLSAIKFAGKTNWNRATMEKLKILKNSISGSLYNSHGWATYNPYSVILMPNSRPYWLSLHNGAETPDSQSFPGYASCVAEF